MVATAARRRSPRLAARGVSPAEKENIKIQPIKRKMVTKPKTKNAEMISKTANTVDYCGCLPRMRELALQQESPHNRTLWVMGIDEAGRGPLAGPVVAAAAVVPTDIPGITDSKKITCEAKRERLYQEILASADASWAVAVVDAQRIDEINILQATMQAMSMAASALVGGGGQQWQEASRQPASVSRTGSYVTCGGKMLKPPSASAASDTAKALDHFYAVVDGNRIPADLPCQGEAIVKGDSKEFSIAAASILAKVTRDRLMNEYHSLWPEYNLAQHKGYPTKEHMAAVQNFGASPIHRRTFAPLKHMTFDENGKTVNG